MQGDLAAHIEAGKVLADISKEYYNTRTFDSFNQKNPYEEMLFSDIEIFNLAIQIASGLSYIHMRGIVH